MTSRRAGLGRTGVTALEDFLELGEAVLAEHTETRRRSVRAEPGRSAPVRVSYGFRVRVCTCQDAPRPG